MMELTTGVVFLMSSLYGGGQADANTAKITMPPPMSTVTMAATTGMTGTLKSTDESDDTSVEAYLRKEFADTPILVDIARCESHFHQFDAGGNIVRGIANPFDVGVMQINEVYHLDTARKLGLDLKTLEGNVLYAKHLYNEQGTAPWTYSSKCWKSGDLAKK